MRFLKSIAAALLVSISVFAQVPPAEQLLPDDIIGLVTVPDWTKLVGGYDRSAWGQLWADPSMKAFRQNFSSNFQADFLNPLEKQLGVKLADYQELLQGQVTLALMPPKEGSKQFMSFLVLIDSKDKSDQLKTRLTELKKKWTDAGKDVKTERIRDTDFSSISFSSAELSSLLKKAFPGNDEDEDEGDKDKPKQKTDAAAAAEKTQLRFGQYKSLLVIGEDEKAIEKILARQGGGLVPPIAEKAAYQKTHQALFRESVAHAWLNFKPVYKKILELAAAEKQPEPTPGAMPSMKVDKILPILGFASLESLAANLNSTAEGSAVDFFVGVPEAQRQGLFKLFTLEKKDASPPAFVPADVLKVQRTRLDGAKAWATVEDMLNKLDPSIAGLVQMMLSSAGKDKDPNFDLKKNLFSNLGDDIIQYEKPPKEAKLPQLQTPPSILLIGSPNPPQLLDAIRLLTSLMPGPLSTAPVKEREFLGKKIYSISMTPPAGALPDPDDEKGGKANPPQPANVMNFCASAGYVAFSSDPSMIEEFLRSAENPPKPLRGTPGLAEAAQKVGGMENGLFTYENQAEALKNDPEGFHRFMFFSLSGGDEEGQGAFRRLFDLKLLPSYERVAKYFGIALVSGATTPDGYTIKAFNPMPSAIKK
jgi:hypothetical protein